MFQGFNEWSNMGKAFFGPFAQMQTLFASLAQKNTSAHFDFGSNLMSATVKYMQESAKSTSMEEVMKNQPTCMMTFLSDLGANGSEYMQRMMNLWQSVMKEFASCVKDNSAKIFPAEHGKQK